MLRLSSPLQLQQVWERPKASPPPSSPIRSTDEQGMSIHNHSFIDA